ncbi:macrophage colony-stimulating factor 1 receptor 1-like isoform X3 [Lytechinus variegatus]|uniref:macrophage colony-stimulating factor 1 receptor 1-like isoform X3 n=1 Tax=Lytechinus variegatus TaxID=7654 RepID=UPI001BB1E52C|nr:macrophage colony-stimulating factor 1 receptor 1-like isoform X3 [Lytechinus variegatus]
MMALLRRVRGLFWIVWVIYIPAVVQSQNSSTTFTTSTSNETTTVPLQNTSQYSTVVTELMTELLTVYDDINATTLETSTGQERSTRTARDADERACRYEPCLGNGDCILADTARGYVCDCRPGYSGRRCEVYTDPCSLNPCYENEICETIIDADYTCTPYNMTTPAPPPPKRASKIYLISNGNATHRTQHLEDKWIIPESEVEMGKLLYSGEFSYVCEGELKQGNDDPIKVALKLLRDENDQESITEMRNEFQVLANLGKHPNILLLLGQCNRVLEQSVQTCLVMEYVARGDMLRILRRCRSRKRDQPPLDPLPQDELLNFACDIAQGMRHVAALRYVYMNLCAKNVLITFHNKAKLCDFSMATEVQKPLIPIPFLEPRNRGMKRWMAYEALLEGQYTMKSDVWSFGIVLWEIVTLGGVPYANKRESDVINELRDHNRLEWPKHCSPELYDIMLRCWHRRPESRPTFDRILKDIKALKKTGTPQINLKDYTYQMYAPIRLDLETSNGLTDSFV